MLVSYGFLFICDFKILRGHKSVWVPCSARNWITYLPLGHGAPYRAYVPEKPLLLALAHSFSWGTVAGAFQHCFVLVLVHIAFDEIGHFLGCSIRPNLVLIRPWKYEPTTPYHWFQYCIGTLMGLSDNLSNVNRRRQIAGKHNTHRSLQDVTTGSAFPSM